MPSSLRPISLGQAVGGVTEYNDFHIAVLMNWVQCKKQKKWNISSKIPINVPSLLFKNYIS
jgi:hypothetical protein